MNFWKLNRSLICSSNLRVAQTIEMLQDHYAQQQTHAAGRPATRAVGCGHLALRGREVDDAGDGFQNLIGRAALLHGQVKKGGLVVALGLHVSLMTPHLLLFKTFAEISEEVMRAGLPLT
jgi:hypothetical protein